MRKIKIFLTTLAIAGVLFATSSCVDDSESASVTELRDAKATLLQKQAELADAQAKAATKLAEVEEIKATADALIADAQNYFIRAEADLIKAKTDVINDSLRLQQANIDKALEELKIQLKIDLLELNAKLAVAQATANLKIQDTLSTLIKKYTEVTAKLNQAVVEEVVTRSVIAKLYVDLALHLVDTTKFVENYIIDQDWKILVARSEKSALEDTKKALLDFEPNADIAQQIADKEAERKAIVDKLYDLFSEIQVAIKAQEATEWIVDSIKDVIGPYERASKGAVYTNVVTLVATTTEPKIDNTYSSTYYKYTYKTGAKTIDNDGQVLYLIGYHEATKANIYAGLNTDGKYEWYAISKSDNPSTEGYYVSKAEYLAIAPLAQWKEDSAKYSKLVQFYSDTVKDLNKNLAKYKTAVETDSIALEKAKKDFDAQKKLFSDKYAESVTIDGTLYYGNALKRIDTTTLNDKAKAVDGKVFTVFNATTGWSLESIFGTLGSSILPSSWSSTPTILLDTSGGAIGALLASQNKYWDALNKLNKYSVAIYAAKSDYYNALINIAQYYAIADSLSTPLVDLKLQLADAEEVDRIKKGAIEEAKKDYQTAQNDIDGLDIVIAKLKECEVRYLKYDEVTKDENDNPIIKLSVIETVVDSITKWTGEIQKQINDKQKQIDSLEITKANVLYLDGNKSYDIEIYNPIQGIFETISISNASYNEIRVQIEANIDAQKKQSEYLAFLIDLYKKQQATYNAAIQALLAAAAEEAEEGE
jgi:hypothetical protein